MGMIEKFEASLQTLRGRNVDITMETQEIQVLHHTHITQKPLDLPLYHTF